MEAKEIQENILFIVADQMGRDIKDLKLSDRFKDDLGVDSLDMVEMIMAAEEYFNITIKDEQAEELVIIQNAVDYITLLLATEHTEGTENGNS